MGHTSFLADGIDPRARPLGISSFLKGGSLGIQLRASDEHLPFPTPISYGTVR